jgi:trigger factor
VRVCGTLVAMQTTVEETDKHTVRLTVEVDPDRVGKDLDRAYRKIAQQVRIPGFRKGKVPRKVIDAQIGRDAVVGEFIEDSVPAYYREAVREHELAPITDPDIDLQDLGELRDGEPLRFTAVVEVRPRLHLEHDEYVGVKVDRPSADVTDAEVDDMVDRLRDRFAELETVPRPAHRGDYVVIDLRATVHDAEVPEATRPDYLYEVGSGEFTGALDDELDGKRAGEILRFNGLLDERFGERAGQEVSFQVLVKEVKGKRLPAADDDFAKTASEFDTLDQLRDALREQLHQNKGRAADGEVRDLVLQKLVDAVDVDLPESLIDEETDHRVQHARERAERAGMTLDQLLESQGFDELRFRSDARAHATRAVKADLVLEAVARGEQMEVSAEELGTEVAQLAQVLGRDVKDVARSLERSGQIVALAGDIIRSKALDFLVEHADISSEDGESRASDRASTEAGPASDAPPSEHHPEYEPKQEQAEEPA